MKKVTIEDQKELLSINNNGYDIVEIPRTKSKWKVGWICDATREKVSLLELESGFDITNEDTNDNVRKRAKFLSKAASYFLLNGIKIYFFHWILWRYFYYIKGYSADQLLPIIKTAKKKVPQVASYICSMLVSQVKITNPTLTKEEAEQFQAELSSGLNLPSEKSTDTP